MLLSFALTQSDRAMRSTAVLSHVSAFQPLRKIFPKNHSLIVIAVFCSVEQNDRSFSTPVQALAYCVSVICEFMEVAISKFAPLFSVVVEPLP